MEGSEHLLNFTYQTIHKVIFTHKLNLPLNLAKGDCQYYYSHFVEEYTEV